MDVIVNASMFEALEQWLFRLLGPRGASRFQGRSADAILKALRVSCVGQAWHPVSIGQQDISGLPYPEEEVTVFDDPLAGLSHGDVDEAILSAYLTLRVVWLAEHVFSDQPSAMHWLCQRKMRLQGYTPLELASSPRHAAWLEQWLVEIDEGNGQ